MVRLCAHGRSPGCVRSDQRHGRLRSTNISLWRTGSGTAVIVPERHPNIWHAPFLSRAASDGTDAADALRTRHN